MFKLYLDPGHGGRDPGATGNGMQEKDINLDIALRIRDILKNNYRDVAVKMSRTTDTFISLEKRTDEANDWHADYFLSIHCNAFNGEADGYEDYIYEGLSESSTTAQYQDILHQAIIAVNQLDDRGQKQANFHVLRETQMSALLTENGFIDNDHDAALMEDASWRQTVARGHVNGLARAFDLEPKRSSEPSSPSQPSSETLYRVIAGSFKKRENANERVQSLRSEGIEAFINPTFISDQLWYRVQAGAFENRDNAEQRLTEVQNAGIEDAFITVEQGESSPEQPSDQPSQDPSEQPSDQPDASGYTIFGDVVLSPKLMDRFAKAVNPDAPTLGEYYATFGGYYGIRGDVAFAQALHETNYFRFTGVVTPEQNNYAGIGATGPENPGASFDTPRDGVLAHIQHLFAYATREPMPGKYPLVDPRFNLVKRGSAKTWIGLNGKWAVPGNNYGQSILTLYEQMLDDAISRLQNVREDINV